MSQLKNSLNRHVLPEDELLARIQAGNRRADRQWRFTKMKKTWISVGVAAAMIVAAVAVWNFLAPLPTGLANGTTTAQTTTRAAAGTTEAAWQAYAMVSIDINPSFEVYTDQAGLVLKIKAKNDDAETIEVKDLIGKPIGEVTTALIARATELGFIKPGDNIDDYVLASTVILDEKDKSAEKNQESLGQKIQAAVAAADLAATTKVAIIKATLQEKHSADKNGVPLGLYIINGMIKNESGTLVPVAEFVKDANNLKQLAKRAEIAAAKAERQETKESRQQGKGPAGTSSAGTAGSVMAAIPSTPAETAGTAGTIIYPPTR